MPLNRNISAKKPLNDVKFTGRDLLKKQKQQSSDSGHKYSLMCFSKISRLGLSFIISRQYIKRGLQSYAYALSLLRPLARTGGCEGRFCFRGRKYTSIHDCYLSTYKSILSDRVTTKKTNQTIMILYNELLTCFVPL